MIFLDIFMWYNFQVPINGFSVMSFNLTNDLLKIFVFFSHALEVFMTQKFYRLFLFIFLVGTLKMTKIYNKWIYEFPHTRIKGNISYLFPINILFINLWHSKMRPHLLIFVIRSRVAMIQTFLPLLWCFATYYKTLDSWRGQDMLKIPYSNSPISR